MQTADTVKAFWNANFFENGKLLDTDGKPKRVKVAIMLTDEQGRQVSIPGIEVTAYTQVGQIVTTFHDYLKANPVNVVDAQPVSDNTKQGTQPAHIQDVEQITHNKNNYLVERLGEDVFRITNIAKGTQIDPTTPVGKTILSKYRDSLQ